MLGRGACAVLVSVAYVALSKNACALATVLTFIYDLL